MRTSRTEQNRTEQSDIRGKEQLTTSEGFAADTTGLLDVVGRGHEDQRRREGSGWLGFEMR